MRNAGSKGGALPTLEDKLYARVARSVLQIEQGRQFAFFGIAGINKSQKDAVPSWVPDFSQFPALYPVHNAMCRYRVGGSDADEPDVEFSKDRSQRATELISCRSRGRQLAMSEKGRPMIVPSGAEKADEIVIFYNSRVPYLLRPVPGTEKHTLVGEAYVHGVVQGGYVVRETWRLQLGVCLSQLNETSMAILTSQLASI
jgi:hypothetical protein